MSKTVIIASAKSNAAVRIEGFTGTTFADLKANPQFASIYGNGDGVEVVVKPGNTTLRDNDSALPGENFSAFIIATKNKAGVTPSDAKEISDTVYTAIVEASSVADAVQKEQLKSNLRTAVANVFNIANGSTIQAPSEVDAELAAALAEARNM